jgi:hypothetical protein
MGYEERLKLMHLPIRIQSHNQFSSVFNYLWENQSCQWDKSPYFSQIRICDGSYFICSVALTLSGVKRAWRRRMPVASKIALAMAGAVVQVEGSPAPRASSFDI